MAAFDKEKRGMLMFQRGNMTAVNGVPLKSMSKEELLVVLEAISPFVLMAKRIPLDINGEVAYKPFFHKERTPTDYSRLRPVHLK